MSAQESSERPFAFRLRAFAVAGLMLAVFIFAGSGSSNAAEGDPVVDPTVVVGDTTTTVVGDTTTTVVGNTTTTAIGGTTTTVVGDTTTTGVPTTTIVPESTTTTTTTTAAPAPTCVPTGQPCLLVAMTARPIAADPVVGAVKGDIVEYVVDVTPLAVGPITQSVLTLPTPEGVGNAFTFLSLDGAPLTIAADGDVGGATATAATVALPSPLVATRVIARMLIGERIPLVDAVPTLRLNGSVRGVDLTLPVTVEAQTQYVPVQQTVADLNVNLTVTPEGWPTLSGPAQFVATVTNLGPDIAESVRVVIAVPAAVDPATFKLTGCMPVAGNPYACTIAKIDPATATTGRIPVQIEFRLRPGTLPGAEVRLTSTVSSSVFDPTDGAANTDTIVTSVDLPTDLGVSFSVLPTRWVSGTARRLSVRVTNDGTTAAHNVRVALQLPEELKGSSLLDPSAPNDRCSLTECMFTVVPAMSGTTAGQAVIQLEMNVDYATPAKDIAFGAAVIPADLVNTTNNVVTAVARIVRSSDVSVELTNVPADVVAGRTFTISGVVANRGPSLSGDMIVTIDGSDLVTGTSATLGGVACTPTLENVVCSVKDLAPGRSRELVISAAARSSAGNSTGAIRVGVALASPVADATDPDIGNNVDTATIAFFGFADLRTSVQAPAQALAGLPIKFTADVVNEGPSDAVGASVMFAVSATFLRVVVLADDPGFVCGEPSDGFVVCGKGTVRVGTPVRFTIMGVTSPDESVRSAVSVKVVPTARTEDIAPANDVSSAEVLISLDSALTVRITANPVLRIIAGEAVSYDVVVQNDGKTRTDRATIVIRKPEGYRGAGPATCADVGDSWECITRPIAAAGSLQFSIRGKAASNLTTGSIFLLSAIVTDSTPNTLPSFDSASAQIIVQSSVTVTPLLDKTVIAGNSFTVIYDVANLGPSDAQNVSIRIVVPDGVSIEGLERCVAENQVLRCSLGTMYEGTPVRLVARLRAHMELADGTLLLLRESAQWNAASSSDERSIIVQSRADLEITQQQPVRAVAGSSATVYLRLSNAGPSVARNVSFEVPVSPAVGSLRALSPTGEVLCTAIERVVRCAAVALTPGFSSTIELRMDVREDVVAPAEIKATMTLASGTEDPAPANNQASFSIPVSAEADLISAMNAPLDVKTGAVADVQITVRNAGPSLARDVVVKVFPPSGLPSLIATGNGMDCQWSLGDDSLHCRVGTVAAGGSATLKLEGVVSQSAMEGIGLTFESRISTQTLDTDMANNVSTASVRVAGKATGRRDLSDPTALTKLDRTVMLGASIHNPGETDVEGIVFTEQIPDGHVFVSAGWSDGDCRRRDLMVLCAFPMIKAGQTVRVQLATVVTAAPALNRSLVTMGAYKAASIPIMFVESADGGFVRPAAGVTPLLVVSPVSPVSVAKPAAANAPLFAGLTLTTLFGLTIVGWLRRSLNEDPVLALAGAT